MRQDPRITTSDGTSVLHAAAAFKNARTIESLITCAHSKIDIDKGLNFNNATALGTACFIGDFETARVLVKAGASVVHMNDHGGNTLTDLGNNELADARMLELLTTRARELGTPIDLNQQMKARTRTWKLIDRGFQLAVRFGLLSTAMARVLANDEGSTALHQACVIGNVRVVSWLLAHGARSSIHLTNALGRTPLDVARTFGPYPAVEALLESAAAELMVAA